MQQFLSMESKKVGTIVRYKRVILRADSGHQLLVFRTTETEIVDMMGYVTSSMRQFNQRSVQALVDQKFHVPPKGHGRVELHESVFASPRGEKQDAHGGERLEHKEERGRFSLYQELGNPLGSRLASPLASTCQR